MPHVQPGSTLQAPLAHTLAVIAPAGPHTSNLLPPSPCPAPPRRQPGGDQVGYAEFSDKMNASKAKNLYHGWTGWGGRGLAIELSDFAMSQLAALPGQKRMREGEGA